MHNRKLGIILACVVLLILIADLVITVDIFANLDVAIFANMEECKAISQGVGHNGDFSAYKDVASDKAIRELKYTDCYAGKYTCDNYDFEIFAYTFETTEDARAYFKNVTGKKSNEMDANYSVSAGIFLSRARIVVFQENRAYIVYTAKADIREVSEFLSSIFTRSLT